MKTILFIRTYANDAGWLKYCLRSILKFCTGYDEVVVVAPSFDANIIRPIVRSAGFRFEVSKTGNPKDGYLDQQVTKMTSDEYTQADYIAYVDSDCCFTKPNTPNELFHGDKPVLIVTPYTALPSDHPWQPITERALRFTCPFETMRREPWIIRRDHLILFQAYMAQIHHMSLQDYVMSQPHRSFSEFNAMGSYLLRYHDTEYHVLDSTKHPLPDPVLNQRWSWGGLTEEIKAEMERILQ
jgi:hypothetical protein